MPLPGGVDTGTVTWTCTGTDGEPIAGVTATFKATPLRLIVPAAPATLLPETVTGVTNAAGVLEVDGSPNIVLVATEQDSVQPACWTWTVSFDFGDRKRPWPGSFSFELPVGAELDLSTVTPVTATAGKASLIGPPGPPGGAAPASTVNLLDLYLEGA